MKRVRTHAFLASQPIESKIGARRQKESFVASRIKRCNDSTRNSWWGKEESKHRLGPDQTITFGEQYGAWLSTSAVEVLNRFFSHFGTSSPPLSPPNVNTHGPQCDTIPHLPSHLSPARVSPLCPGDPSISLADRCNFHAQRTPSPPCAPHSILSAIE